MYVHNIMYVRMYVCMYVCIYMCVFVCVCHILTSQPAHDLSHVLSCGKKPLSPDRDERASELKPLSWRMAKGYSSSWFFSGKWLESLATMDTYIEAEYNTSKNHGESQCDTLNISECYPLVN